MAGIHAAIAAPYPGFSATLTDHSVGDVTHDGSTATATFTIKNDGTVRDQDNNSLETWLPSGSASNWDVRATLNSGTSPSGSGVGSWLSCGTTRSWSLVNSTQPSSITCSLLIELRSGGITAASATATITSSALDPI